MKNHRKEIEEILNQFPVPGKTGQKVIDQLLALISKAQEEAVLKFKYTLMEWCQCPKCEPRENNSHFCKNSTWPIYQTEEEFIQDSLKGKKSSVKGSLIAKQPTGGKVWNCRFHPTDWWHEIGCPHMKWTKKQLKGGKGEK